MRGIVVKYNVYTTYPLIVSTERLFLFICSRNWKYITVKIWCTELCSNQKSRKLFQKLNFDNVYFENLSILFIYYMLLVQTRNQEAG